MATEKPRYCITVDEDMLKDIDDFRFANRYNSRSQATVELIRLGLQKLREIEWDKEHTNNTQPKH
ncbi:MAG: ribbon-helix-helix domain-containing protein [Clostridiales bacterium]|nr:ribbon-helix-helix domain-containing protein [Clostridiales bacterium]